MFKYKRFRINFEKAYIPDGYKVSSWYEVRDSFLISCIDQIKAKYEFNIIKIKLRPTFHQSYILIRCKRDECEEILSCFCKLAGKYIDKVSA